MHVLLLRSGTKSIMESLNHPLDDFFNAEVMERVFSKYDLAEIYGLTFLLKNKLLTGSIERYVTFINEVVSPKHCSVEENKRLKTLLFPREADHTLGDVEISRFMSYLDAAAMQIYEDHTRSADGGLPSSTDMIERRVAVGTWLTGKTPCKHTDLMFCPTLTSAGVILEAHWGNGEPHRQQHIWCETFLKACAERVGLEAVARTQLFTEWLNNTKRCR